MGDFYIMIRFRWFVCCGYLFASIFMLDILIFFSLLVRDVLEYVQTASTLLLSYYFLLGLCVTALYS